MTELEKNIDILKRFGHVHLAIAYELSAHHYMGLEFKPHFEECKDRLDQASKDYDEYLKNGTIPEWMKEKYDKNDSN